MCVVRCSPAVYRATVRSLRPEHHYFTAVHTEKHDSMDVVNYDNPNLQNLGRYDTVLKHNPYKRSSVLEPDFQKQALRSQETIVL